MTINSIDPYASQYQSYKIPSVSQPFQEPEKSPIAVEASSVNRDNEKLPVAIQSTSRSTNQMELETLSLSFQKRENFDYVGKNSEIGNLDVQKAISDMKKDQILEEYQFFVGSSTNFMQEISTQDGTIIPKI